MLSSNFDTRIRIASPFEQRNEIMNNDDKAINNRTCSNFLWTLMVFFHRTNMENLLCMYETPLLPAQCGKVPFSTCVTTFSTLILSLLLSSIELEERKKREKDNEQAKRK